MNDSNIQYVLIYYFIFWLFNSLAYGIVSVGMYKWTSFAYDGTTIFHTRIGIITAVFGLARFVIGGIAVWLYCTGQITPWTTIPLLGMTSLLLNTAFIAGEGVLLNKEAKRIDEASEEERNVVRQAAAVFRRLDHIVANA